MGPLVPRHVQDVAKARVVSIPTSAPEYSITVFVAMVVP